QSLPRVLDHLMPRARRPPLESESVILGEASECVVRAPTAGLAVQPKEGVDRGDRLRARRRLELGDLAGARPVVADVLVDLRERQELLFERAAAVPAPVLADEQVVAVAVVE